MLSRSAHGLGKVFNAKHVGKRGIHAASDESLRSWISQLKARGVLLH